MDDALLQRYNIPVPRYTSYPPATFFHAGITAEQYEQTLIASNTAVPGHISFYIHIPFCRRLCHYCGCNATQYSSKVELDEYLEAIKQEFMRIKPLLHPDRKVAQIHYGGGSPSILSIEQLQMLNEMILSSFDTIDKPEIAIECHPGYLDRNFWSNLRRAGFTRISVGCQDLSPTLLKAINRKPSQLPIEEIAELLHEQSLPFSFDLIYGLPQQSVAHYVSMLERIVLCKPSRIVTFSYAHVPWVNPAMLHLEQLGLPSQAEKQALFDAICKTMSRLGYHQIGMDHFVQPTDELYEAQQEGKLYRNFQGYCSRRTTGQVYGLGNSAISQLAGGFFQNEKTPQAYMQKIKDKQIPLSKGYLLSDKDRLTGELITYLMCNYQVDLKVIAEQHHLEVEALLDVLQPDWVRLEAMRADGLLTYTDYVLCATPTGRLFVRNIASLFDQYYEVGNRHYSKPI